MNRFRHIIHLTALTCAIMGVGATPMTLSAQAAGTNATLPPLPVTQNGGRWKSGHVQGIAVDRKGGYIYYSFTNLLVKYDFNGKLVGTLRGWTGHLGDMDFNPADGKLYGSLEYKQDNAFYIAVIDGRKINRVGMDAVQSGLFKTVYLPEVVRDYTADMNGDGRFDGDDTKSIENGPEHRTPDHRYGCSGIDGVAFGPAFGHEDGPLYLTVAYGIYGDGARTDNDHQVLLQYDITGWTRHARPLSEKSPHHNGPDAPHGKYFVRTGNTTYGVQNLAYDPFLHRWFMGVYRGKKTSFPNYGLFAIDASASPRQGDLIGVAGKDKKSWEQALLLPLANDGLQDPVTAIRGWNQKADVGFQPVGGGLYYLAVNSVQNGLQTADLTLMRWTGNANTPFVPATGADHP